MNTKHSRIFIIVAVLGVIGALVVNGLSWAQTGQTKPKVAIDAGHGGSDSGIKAGSETEKDWNLKVALALQKALESAGFEVVMTRKGDDTLETAKRTSILNTSQALAVIVVHADRDWTGTQSGPCLTVEPPNQNSASEEEGVSKLGAITLSQYRSSLKLARSIAQELGVNGSFGTLSDSRGALGESVVPAGRVYCLPHQDLRYLIKPAVVLTPLFLTSATDIKKLGPTENLAAFASKVAQGVADYLQVSVPKQAAAPQGTGATAVPAR
jgi:N-acetylmuramoyl-L-alanine amidase